MSTPDHDETSRSAESTAVPDPIEVARAVARAHAAGLTAVARQRVWLFESLARGKDVTELAHDLKVTPRAIRHLLGPS
ncbi:MAG TPA: hypothetical protein VMZ00_04065 [Sporichthya sp.]|nr:hypothetical protein [Sporichthya sp.]